MKRIQAVLAASLMMGASYAHAFGLGVRVFPMVYGPRAQEAYQALINALTLNGAETCNPEVHRVCHDILISFHGVRIGKISNRGRGVYVVGTVMTIRYTTDPTAPREYLTADAFSADRIYNRSRTKLDGDGFTLEELGLAHLEDEAVQ